MSEFGAGGSGLQPHDAAEPFAAHKTTWNGENSDGCWRNFTYEEILIRDKLSLDLFCLKDDSVEDSDSLLDPDVLAQDIVDDLLDALEQFASIAGKIEGVI